MGVSIGWHDGLQECPSPPPTGLPQILTLRISFSSCSRNTIRYMATPMSLRLRAICIFPAVFFPDLFRKQSFHHEKQVLIPGIIASVRRSSSRGFPPPENLPPPPVSTECPGHTASAHGHGESEIAPGTGGPSLFLKHRFQQAVHIDPAGKDGAVRTNLSLPPMPILPPLRQSVLSAFTPKKRFGKSRERLQSR